MSKKAEEIKEIEPNEKVSKAKEKAFVSPVQVTKNQIGLGETPFEIYKLREHSRQIFGVRPEILDGALFDYPETRITKSEAERRIRAFMAQEVKKL